LRLVKERRTSWETLVAQGKARKPSEKSRGHVVAWFLENEGKE
jgi:hypothetical protein